MRQMILAKPESAYGVDAAPTGAADSIQISNASYEIMYNNVDRSLLRTYLGASEQLVGTRWVKATFDVEISGSGTAGTPPRWGTVLRGCAMAETVTVGQRAEYSLLSDGFESLTIHYHDDGLRHILTGCMGNVELAMGEGERPLFKCTFVGLDAGAAAAANPTQTFTAWRAPDVVTDFNSGDIKLGGSYAAGVITGGTAYKSRGLQLNLGNDVKQLAFLGGQSVDITDRATTGSMELELSAADEASFLTSINANTLTGLSFEHGTTAGRKFLVWAPKAQRINPKKEEYEGIRLVGMDLRLTPDAGNDELLIVSM